MLPGSTNVYLCPNCSKSILQWTLASANGIGAKYFSDGRVKAPYFPETLRITRCGDCGTIFWLDRESIVDEFEDDDFREEDARKSAHYQEYGIWAEELDKEGWVKAIQEKVYRNPKEEVYLRKKLLWCLNDLFLVSYGILETVNSTLYLENASNLIKVLEDNSQKDLLLMAELHRNLGDFESCLEVLDQVTEPDLLPLAFAIFKKCNLKESKVFELS
ncbi:hypothetical protein [Shivajiella indica]|uniref:DUF2225 domain-containing protein n=1 Tax=Shivajiella indica TaxID=872115 RepID=A0ABW5B9I0_9BACT